MLDWLIVGGGVIGTTVSNYLVNRYGVAAGGVRVLDPHLAPLARWTRMTGATGMRYLRSPHVHHIDVEPLSLREFGESPAGAVHAGYIRPYDRPSYALFQEHAVRVIEKRELAALRLQGTAEFIMSTRGGYVVQTDNGQLRAKRVVLAIGRTALYAPPWAQALQDAGADVRHVFTQDAPIAADPATHTVVVGGGITGGQVALGLAEGAPGAVTLLTRHPLQQADFDSSPCWLGPRCKGVFLGAASYEQRRRLLGKARNRGTMAQDVFKAVGDAVRDGRLRHFQGDVVFARGCADGRVVLKTDEAMLQANRVVLATGFDGARPGGAWLDEVIEWFDLPVAPCGYPVVDSGLQWRRGLHVAGPLAELELGPPAGNIVGGRLAAERLAPVTEAK